MSLLTFQDNSAWLNLLLFGGAATAIWYAGTKLERYADAIAWRTGLGQAFVGLLLLAAATSLPEVATSVTAVLIGNTALAVHNLLGGVVLQTGVLAVADVVGGRRALTHRSPRYVLLMEGLGVVFLLTIVLMGAALGRETEATLQEPSWQLGVGLWVAVLLLAYLLVLYTTHRSQGNPRWQPNPADQEARRGSGPDLSDQRAAGEQSEQERRFHDWSTTTLGLAFAAGSLVVLVAGWTVARTGDALSQQTGLAASFVGTTLVALATSLPEISTTAAAARAGNDEMAISNVFGSNAFDITLLCLVGVLAGGQAVIQSAAPSAAFAAALAILVTCVYLWGMLERQDRSVLRMGWDSAIVLGLVVAGNVVIYFLK